MASDTYGAILLTTANDVGAMIQKKMATPSETYAPAVWAKTINLLGKLPEATVSGSIVTFSDGADEVPIKSWEVTLPASLDGYSSVNVIHAGKNLWEFGDKTVDTVAYIMLYFTKPLPAGTYTVSCELTSTTTTCSFRFRKEDGSYLVQTSFTANAGRVSQTLTLPEPAYRVYIYSSTQAGGEVTTWKNVQIEVGATMTDFVAYSAPTTHTVQLGRTIYGGTADIITGEGEDENGNAFTFTPITPTPETALGTNNFWADEGDSDVTYRRDIDLALQALSGLRGLMMARPPAAAETEETEPEDETTETIEETPEDMEK